MFTDKQLHEQSKTLATFETKLNEIGADFPQSFVKNLDRLIVTMHPKYKRKAAKLKAAKAKANGGDDKAIASMDTDIKSRKFPGLSMPDSEWTPLDAYVDERDGKGDVEKLPESISMDNTMAELQAVASRRNRPAADDYMDGEPSNKRMRNDGGGHQRDNGYGSRNGQQGREQDGGYGGKMGAPRGSPGSDAMDDQPVLYKIYNGNVTNVRDFGAFVGLEGIRGRVEGKSTSFAHERIIDHQA
jgi:ATP-dependent RNA helicase DHX8/PRP22